MTRARREHNIARVNRQRGPSEVGDLMAPCINDGPAME